jgi:hypothetical protein
MGFPLPTYTEIPIEVAMADEQAAQYQTLERLLKEELKTGDGKLTPTGAITPDGAVKTAVNVTFKLAEARRLGATVLAYLRAWDVMRMMIHQEMVSVPPPYTLSPSSGSETKSVPVAAMKENGRLENGRSTNGRSAPRPVTRKTTAVAARKPVQGVLVGKNGNTPRSPLPRLLYGDGLLVSMENEAERTAYVSYRQVNGNVPPSKTALQAFYQQQA